jgi:aminopeptidase N
MLLSQLSTATRVYVAPEHREDVRARVSDRFAELARSAEPGSDRQLQLVSAFAGYASSGEHVAFLAALLDGSQTLAGLAVDADMRWTLLTGLVAAGAAGRAEIDAELERDATANGARAAAAARAAIPTPAAKEEAWTSVAESDALPNAVQQSVIGGFGRVHDVELLRPYVGRYFAVIEDVWTTRTNEIAQQIVVGLYPMVLSDQGLLEATDAWVEGHPEAPSALRRLVIENRDTVARALRVQARDHEA